MVNFEFKIGGLVTGDNFIGRKIILNRVVNSLGKISFAINGMNKIGKTSLIRNAIEIIKKKESNIFIYYKELYTVENINILMFGAFKKLLSEIESAKKDEISFLTEYDKNVFRGFSDYFKNDDNEFKYHFKHKSEDLLKLLKKINSKVVIVIDEFDKALEIFKSEDFNMLRSICHDPDTYSFFGVLVSRMTINEIEIKTANTSKMSGVLSDIISLTGFSDEDMNEYYTILQEKNDTRFSDDFKSDLEYYTGNHPFMLSLFGKELYENGIQPPFLIYEQKVTQINGFYESLLFNMSSDAEINNNLPSNIRREKIDLKTKLLQYHIGPKMDFSKNDMLTLINRGYLVERIKGGQKKFDTVSEDFLEYFTLKTVEIHNDVWPDLLELQSTLRHLILESLGGGDLNKCENYLLKYALEENKVTDQRNLYLESNQKQFYVINKDTISGYQNQYKKKPLLNKLNFIELLNIIKDRKHFDTKFKKYFKTDEIIKNGKQDFKLLREARNSIAHDDKQLTKSEILKVNEICAKYKKEIIINL